MRYCILLDAIKNQAKLLPLTPGVSLLENAYKVMGCRSVQLLPLYPGRIPEGYEAVTDDEVWCRICTKVFNPLASWLYGTDDHGTPIMNNVVIFKVKRDDLTGMTEEEAQSIADDLNSRADEIYDLTMFRALMVNQ